MQEENEVKRSSIAEELEDIAGLNSTKVKAVEKKLQEAVSDYTKTAVGLSTYVYNALVEQYMSLFFVA